MLVTAQHSTRPHDKPSPRSRPVSRAGRVIELLRRVTGRVSGETRSPHSASSRTTWRGSGTMDMARGQYSAPRATLFPVVTSRCTGMSRSSSASNLPARRSRQRARYPGEHRGRLDRRARGSSCGARPVTTNRSREPAPRLPRRSVGAATNRVGGPATFPNMTAERSLPEPDSDELLAFSVLRISALSTAGYTAAGQAIRRPSRAPACSWQTQWVKPRHCPRRLGELGRHFDIAWPPLAAR